MAIPCTRFYSLLVFLSLLPLLAVAKPIRVATLNVHNYTLAHRQVDGVFAPDYPKPEVEKAALRRLLIAVDADVVCLQEMGAVPFLEELRRDLRTLGLEYPHALLLRAADENRHLAALSKIPWDTATRHTAIGFTIEGKTESVKRGLMELRFSMPDGRTWTLYNLHLRSRLTENEADPNNARLRAAEATAIRNLILKQHAEEAVPRYLIAGDFNDTPDSAALRRFLRKGDQTPALLLPTADDRGHTWTYHHKRAESYSRIDYQLPSPALLPFIKCGRAFIPHLPTTVEASDHRLVYVDLEVGE